MNDIDFTDDIDLIDHQSDYGTDLTNKEGPFKVCESADRGVYGGERTRMFFVDKLMEENKMKEQALEKASNIIELLKVDLKVKEKSFEESLNGLREEYTKKLDVAKQNQAKLQQKIVTLEKKNSLLEFQLKRRVEPQRKQLRPKSSARSILRESHSEERKVESSRLIKYVRVSPKKNQKEQSPRKRLSIQTNYVKKVLGELLTEESIKLSSVQELLETEQERLNDYIEVLSNNKAELKELPQQPATETTRGVSYFRSMHEQLSNIVREQQTLITALRNQEQELKLCLHEFLNIIISSHSQHNSSHGPNLSELERLLSIMTRSIKERFVRRKKDSEELRVLRANNAELSRMSKLYSEVKYYIGLKDNSPHQEVLNRIEGLKLQCRSQEDENIELKSIVEGLIKLAKK